MQIKWLAPAILDLQRLRDFIFLINRDAALRAVKIIKAAVAALATTPHIGKPVENMPDYRDLVIPFGSAGYLLRYRIRECGIYRCLAPWQGSRIYGDVRNEVGFAEGVG